MLKWAERLLWLLVAISLCLTIYLFVPPSSAPACQPIKEDESTASANYGSERPCLPEETFGQRLTSDPVAGFALVLDVFTLALAVIAGFQVVYMAKADETARQQVRAYVKLSHISPPGLNGPSEDGTFRPGARVSVTVEIRNSGRTPARVTDVRLKCLITDVPLPDEPDYSETGAPHIRINGFLVANDYFFHGRHWDLTDAEVEALNVAKKRLYVIGYVDYIDGFRTRHRGGYARQYDRRAHEAAGIDLEARKTRNNLTFVTERGYNYDRARPSGMGDDWNDPED